jgi:TonB-dependent receptor
VNSRNQFRARSLRAVLLAGAGSTLLAAAMPAMAQDTAPAAQDEEDAIVVTGIRETIQNSINTKREETAIVDALSADDIGDLPALSVGQAIQTITGATTHREKGDASEIALRGLGPFLSNATFNGRDATNGSGDRSVNFNQFPSELVNNIKIYKTQQADLVEGGVAGTIEIGTLRPLDFGKRRIQAEVKAQYNPYGDRIVGSGGIGWRGTLSYVDQFANDTIGIAIGVQRNDTNNPEETYAAPTMPPAAIAANSRARITARIPIISSPTPTSSARSARPTSAMPRSARSSGAPRTGSTSISTSNIRTALLSKAAATLRFRRRGAAWPTSNMTKTASFVISKGRVRSNRTAPNCRVRKNISAEACRSNGCRTTG